MLVAAAYENPCRGCVEQITELGGVKVKIAVGPDEFPMGVAIVVDHQEIARLHNHRELAHEFKRLKEAEHAWKINLFEEIQRHMNHYLRDRGAMTQEVEDGLTAFKEDRL